ncbi:hypothetical protein ACFE04_017309 [Oxalis oulophora]
MATPCHDSEIVEVDPSGRYVRYQQRLGTGSFKRVYKAFDQVSGLEVAWSLIKKKDLLRSKKKLEDLYSEVMLLRSIKHEHVLRYYNSWVDEKKQNVNIITELFSSGNLREYREKYKQVDMRAVKGWGIQILMGLDYLHSQSPPIIHRDLKCDNIFINGNVGEVKIGDLGLATVMDKADPITNGIGTIEFMAPELFDEDYDESVDIYAFGMCMLELVTCEFPYSECAGYGQLFKKVSRGIKPAALSIIKDYETREFIEKCLLPASQRPSAKELLNDPFLQVNGFLRTHPLPLLDIISPKMGPVGDYCLVSEGPISSAGSRPSNMDFDYDDEMPVITNMEYLNGGDHPFSVEIERTREECVFLMSGNRNSQSSISVKVRVADLNAARALEIDFPFNVAQGDTAISIAREMVEELELEAEDIIFMAEFIDMLMLYLIPTWATSVPIDHLIQKSRSPIIKSPCQKNSSPPECGESSTGSFLRSSAHSVNHSKSHFCLNPFDESVGASNSVSHREVSIANVNHQKPNIVEYADSMNSYQSAHSGFLDRDEHLLKERSMINGVTPTTISSDQGDNLELQFELDLAESGYEETTEDLRGEKMNRLSFDSDLLLLNSLVID